MGRIIDDRYRILERLGEGGMGVVFKVEHARIGKTAALKRLHPHLAARREFVRRFEREAQLISRLDHPNVIQVFDYGKVENTVYLVTEYLHGEDLANVMQREGLIPLERATNILLQVCDALIEAHSQGVIHRDVKPENIFVTTGRDGSDRIKVLDFGIAKLIRSSLPKVTSENQIVGTPHYMAPEQIRAEEIDERCDVYSLGALFYRLLTNTYVFDAPNPVTVLGKHVSEDPIPPSQVAPLLKIPKRIDAIVMRSLAKSRDQRFRSVRDFRAELVAVGAEPSLPAIRVTAPQWTPSQDVLSRKDFDRFERSLRWSQRLKVMTLIAGIGIAVGAAGYFFMARQKPTGSVQTSEIEPNNLLEQVNAIPLGVTIQGHLGKRHSETASDRDWYAVSTSAGTAHDLRIRLDGIPNMDVVLELYNSQGERLISVDATRVGGMEILPNFANAQTQYNILVREVWQAGVRPNENVTDAYALTVESLPRQPGWEREPNDQVESANAISSMIPTQGYIGVPTDRDYFSVVLPAGTWEGTVGGEGLDPLVEVKDPGAASPKTIDRAGPNREENIPRWISDGKTPLILTVASRRQKKVEREWAGATHPYVIKFSSSKRSVRSR